MLCTILILLKKKVKIIVDFCKVAQLSMHPIPYAATGMNIFGRGMIILGNSEKIKQSDIIWFLMLVLIKFGKKVGEYSRKKSLGKIYWSGGGGTYPTLLPPSQ